MEHVIIRRGRREDIPALHELIRELGVYEKAEHEVQTTPAQLERDAFCERPLFEFIVAETGGGEIVGAAVFYFGYSTWKGKQLYLDDLVVTENYRRHSIGQQLLDYLVAYAREEDANQMRWHVLNWNEPAIRFYEKIQSSLEDDWITCKLTRTQLETYQPGGTYTRVAPDPLR